MDEAAITRYVAEHCPGVDVVAPTDGPGAGDIFFIYDPDRNLDDRQRFPFATIVTKNYGYFYQRSQVYSPREFRLNVGVDPDT